MTKAKKKRQEALYVEACASQLARPWRIVTEGEAPDFLIDDSGVRFGLEVTNLFLEDDGRGSAIRWREGRGDKIMQKIRRAYEDHSGTTIDLKLPRRPKDADAADLVDKLIALKLEDKPVGTRAEFLLSDGTIGRVQRSYHPSWLVIEDAVGWVDRNGGSLLQALIERKAIKLREYERNVGGEMRLLVIADRMRNSGKIEVRSYDRIDTMGFAIVYFFSYPDHVLSWAGV